MKRFLIALALIAALGGSYYYFKVRPSQAAQPAGDTYEFAKIERRTVKNMVSATGTLSARDVVEISTQVSGKLDSVLADFNDQVEQGQLIAMIDPSVLDAQVKIAQADLLRSKAQLQQAQANFERFKPVYEKGFLSDNDFQPYQIALQTAEANLLASEASLDRAMQNRGYAEIRSPISGVVIDRTIEQGQTVAASLNAPKLFTIANDLSKMEILAKVDESDIGQIKTGQAVRFSVASYLDRNFTGSVTQIRLLPDVIQNVVNYTVVVEASNDDGLLLPGMTASLDFVVAEVEDALSVPTSALNLRPNEEMSALMEARRAQRQAEREARGGGSGPSGGGEFGERRGGGDGPSGGSARSNGNTRRRSFTTLWYQEDGELKMMPVRAGVSDGAFTQVLPLRDQEIPEDLQVITRIVSTAAPSATARTTSNSRTGLGRLGF